MAFEPDIAARAARFFEADYGGYDDDLATLVALARRTGGPLLELGCGTGRALAPLAQAGFRVTGIDKSESMLALARVRLEKANLAKRAALISGDFAESSLGGPFKLAVVLMNTFMHLLSQGAQVQALAHWRRHLTPAGLLLIDLFQPDIHELAGLSGQWELEKRWVDPESGLPVLKHVARTADPAQQLIHVTFAYDEIAHNGAVRRTLVPFDLRYLWRFEAELLLERCGFVVEAVYGGWDFGPLETGSERLILLAHPSS